MGDINKYLSYSDFSQGDINCLERSLIDILASEIMTLSDKLRSVRITIVNGVSQSMSGSHKYSFDVDIDEKSCSIGAVDVTVEGMPPLDFFYKTVDLCMRGRVKFGQVILYGGKFVHLSNDPMEIYHPKIGRMFSRNKYIIIWPCGKKEIVRGERDVFNT